MNPFIRADILYILSPENREIFHVLAQRHCVCVCVCLPIFEGVALEMNERRAETGLSSSLKDTALPQTPSKEFAG